MNKLETPLSDDVPTFTNQKAHASRETSMELLSEVRREEARQGGGLVDRDFTAPIPRVSRPTRRANQNFNVGAERKLGTRPPK